MDKNFDDLIHRNDFANGAEIMVTITLAEYRELIEFKATGQEQIRQSYRSVRELERQIENLQNGTREA